MDGLTRRKTCRVRQTTTGTMFDWVRLQLTDPNMLAGVTTDADIQITDASGKPLQTVVLSRSPLKIELAVAYDNASQSEHSLYVYTGSRSVLPKKFDRAPGAKAPPAAKLDLSWTTGRAISTTNQSIHPHVLQVPAGSWMADNGSGSTVTHIMIDTPFPAGAGQDQYENPSLAYSMDNGATWFEWPGITNPIDPSPGGTSDYNADPCLTIMPDGHLRAYYREYLNGVVAMKYRDISGTNLSACTVGEEQTATFATSTPRSLTIYQVSDDLWYGFGEQGISPTVTLAVYRWTSTDRGVTWTKPTAMIAQTASTVVSPVSGWWHGGQVVKVGDLYWCAWTEPAKITYHPDAANYAPRLFYSADLTTWKPCRNLLMTAAPAWAPTRFYAANLYMVGDRVWLIFSAASSTSYYIGRLEVGDLTTISEISDELSIGFDRTKQGTTVVPDAGYYDLAEGPGQGLADLGGKGRDLAVNTGSPAYVAGTGYAFDRDRGDSMVSNASVAGLLAFEVEAVVTTPAVLGDVPNILLAEQQAADSTRSLAWYYQKNKWTAVLYNDAGDYISLSSPAGSVAPSTTYHLRLCYVADVTGWKLRLFINGAVSGELVNIGAVRSMNNPRLTVGAYLNPVGGNSYPGSFILHRLVIREGYSRRAAGRNDTAIWKPGHETITVPLQAVDWSIGNDTVADNATHCSLAGLQAIKIRFNHPLDAASLTPGAVSINGLANGDTSALIEALSLSPEGDVVTVILSAPLPDADTYTFTVTSATLTQDGNSISGPASLTIRVLAGDVDASGAVTQADVLAVRNAVGSNLNTATSRFDLDGSGVITGEDMRAARKRIGNRLP